MVTVGDIMTRDVIVVTSSTSLITTARLFAERHITGAPVIDELGRPIGVVTQTDLVDPDRARAGSPGVVDDVMSHYVLSVAPDAPLLDAAKLMAHEQVHRVLVVEHGRLVGILTSMDVLRAVADLASGMAARASAR